MWDIGAQEHHIAHVEALDAVADDALSMAFCNIDKLAFRVKMEWRVKIWITTLDDRDLVISKSSNFYEDGFHPLLFLAVGWPPALTCRSGQAGAVGVGITIILRFILNDILLSSIELQAAEWSFHTFAGLNALFPPPAGIFPMNDANLLIFG